MRHAMVLGLLMVDGFTLDAAAAPTLPPPRTSSIHERSSVAAPANFESNHFAIPPDPEQGGELELEREDDPYMPGLRGLDGNAIAGAPRVVQVGPFISRQVNVNPQGQNILGDAANEPSMAISPVNPNLVVIGWRQFDNVASNFRQAGYGYSTNGGSTWTFPGVLEPGVFRSDPVLDSLSAPGGAILYNSLCGSGCPQNFLCDMFVSTDAVNWSKPIPAFGGDKQWMTTDKTNGPGHDFIDYSWSTAAGCCANDIFTRSVDGGQTYMTPIALPSSPIWGTPTIGPDGTLYICGISGTTYRVVKSTNAQIQEETPTFTPSVTVNMGGTPSNNASSSPNPGGLLGQVWIAADRSGGAANGNLYMVVSANPSGTDPLDVMFSRSTNGGTAWSTPVRINTDPANAGAWQWFATMSVAPNGRIDVFWNDTRANLLSNLSELFYAYSLNAGANWSPNIRVSPQFDSTIGWPNQNKIGDYYHSISDNAAANLAYAATFNGEEDVWFLRAGDCNHNGIHDGVDLANGTLHDANHNGVPDECEVPCPADVAPPGGGGGGGGGNGVVNIDDLLAIINHWGPAAPGSPYDISPPGGNGVVNIDDLLTVINAWGVCP